MSSSSELYLLSPIEFDFKAAGHDSDILQAAFPRYVKLMFLDVAPTLELENITPISGCDVNVLTANENLDANTDESYSLSVKAPRIQITANTVFGALRGMESLSQLVQNGVVIEGTEIEDKPRFSFRASMIDTSRHWYPVDVILQHLDAMSYSKFNVLHWHLVDSQSFPLELKSAPLLAQAGAYTPTHVYTQDDVKNVIQFARYRGIRVIPEIDTPGHVWAGWTAYPHLLTQCYDSHGHPDGTGPLDPTNEATYDFLKKVYAEMKDLFPDKFVHVGGDEVPFECWQSNPNVTAFMKAHPEIKDYAALESYYEVRLLEMLAAQNTSYLCWQEIFDNGVKILPDTVVDVWKGDIWQKSMTAVTQAGFHSVLSAPFYLNYISYGEDWPKYYNVEPLDFPCDKCDKSLVDGIEMCMWSEFVDATNFMPRTWPRAAAVSERAWSAQDVTDLTDAGVRLHQFRCKLIARGIPAEPIVFDNPQAPHYCQREWDPQRWTVLSSKI